MERSKVIEEVKLYFSESDHWRRLCLTLQGDTDPHSAHVHAYVDTSVDPYSIEAIIIGYFERLGCPSSRKIDHLATGKGSGSLHGVEPESKPHFDFQWFYNKGVGLRAHEGGEGGCNLLAWNRWYINQYYLQYDFREVTSEDEKILKPQLSLNFYENLGKNLIPAVLRSSDLHLITLPMGDCKFVPTIL